jgi:hypothetical protein
MTCADARHLLERLLAEGSTTLATDLVHNVIYMDDLEAARAAYVGWRLPRSRRSAVRPAGRLMRRHEVLVRLALAVPLERLREVLVARCGSWSAFTT